MNLTIGNSSVLIVIQKITTHFHMPETLGWNQNQTALIATEVMKNMPSFISRILRNNSRKVFILKNIVKISLAGCATIHIPIRSMPAPMKTLSRPSLMTMRFVWIAMEICPITSYWLIRQIRTCCKSMTGFLTRSYTFGLSDVLNVIQRKSTIVPWLRIRSFLGKKL